MTLNLSKVSEAYFNKLFTKGESGRSHVLLVDEHTTPIISLSYTQSQLLANNIILVELVENQAQLHTMKHLDCIVYIKPTKESVLALLRELHNPHFNSYKVFANNLVHKNQLEKLAEADEFEVVTSVVELFQDYLILNDNLFSWGKSLKIADESSSLLTLLLSVKKCPIIKYESTSDVKRLASEVLYNINLNSNNNLFDDLNSKLDVPPVLVLLDRKNDPITPLMTPWTYQSMIHEFITIKLNIAKLTADSGVENIILSDTQDKFFKESMFLNYGDLTENFQRHVENYKKQTKQSSLENLKIQNLNELKKILTRFPEFKKLLNIILKHLNLITELDKQISEQDLWNTGELQQLIICGLDTQLNLSLKLVETLENPKIPLDGKLRLVLIYSIKFPLTNEIPMYIAKLNNPGYTSPAPTLSQLQLVKKFSKLFKYTPVSADSNNGTPNPSHGNFGDLYKNKINSLFNIGDQNVTKNENVYMQYTPRLAGILNVLINNQEGNLTELVPDVVTSQYGKGSHPVQDIIIYIKGGLTYEEARLAHEMNSTNPKINIIIGGDYMINSKQWMEQLYDKVNETSALPDNPLGDRSLLRELL